MTTYARGLVLLVALLAGSCELDTRAGTDAGAATLEGTTTQASRREVGTETVVCDRMGARYTDDTGWHYAEKQYPGRSAAELSAIRVLQTDASYEEKLIPGYSQAVVSAGVWGIPVLFVKEGSVAVLCGAGTRSELGTFEVTLITPW